MHGLALVVKALEGTDNPIGIRRWFERSRQALEGAAPLEQLAKNWLPEHPGPQRLRALAEAARGGRWNRPDDPPRHDLASTPLVAWAEWLRHQEIHDPEDLEGVAAALWAVLLPPNWGPETLPLVVLPETVVLSDEGGAQEQRRAALTRLQRQGAQGLQTPTAALIERRSHPSRRWCSCSGARRKPCWVGPACRRAAPGRTCCLWCGGWGAPRAFALPDLGPGLECERLEALAQALQTIAADPTVQALVLFGSHATGNARPDSDVDLLVVERTPHLEGTRWHVISEAARHGQVVVLRST